MAGFDQSIYQHLSFGGGYVVVPMIRKYYVEKKRLFSNDELMEMAAVAQSSPGAIAINLRFWQEKRWQDYLEFSLTRFVRSSRL